MSKPYSQPGEKGTDTNQASEDALEQHLLNDKAFQHILKFAPESQRELMTFELARYIDALIRTEKLKLLAEVRERVIGEPISDNWDDDIDGMIEWKYYTYYRTNAYDFVDGYNMSIAERLEQLTKLEAEL